MSTTRILYVITKPRWGGAQRYVYDLAVSASERGDAVSVAVGGTGELTERLMAAGIPVEQVRGLGRDVDPVGDLRALVELVRLMRALKPDVIHLNSSKAGFTGALAARFARAPRIVFTAHGWAFNEQRPAWQRAIFALLHLVTVWCVDEVICVSDAARKQAAWMPARASKFVVIHNGVAPIKLLPKDEARAKLAPEFAASSSSETLWIGTLAELHPVKGLDVLFNAFAKLKDSFSDARLVCIGEGQERARLEALARKLDIADRVRLCGHVEEGSRYLSAFDIFAFPSRSEGLGYAALEAGFAQLPVVASRVGGVPEIIMSGVTGLLVPAGDASALKDALETLLRDSALRDKLAGNLHHRVLQDFSQKQMIEKTFATYDRYS